MYRAIVVETRWSGHGEGGVILGVEIDGFTLSNPYNNADNPVDKKIVNDAADYINRAIEFYQQAQAKPA